METHVKTKLRNCTTSLGGSDAVAAGAWIPMTFVHAPVNVATSKSATFGPGWVTRIEKGSGWKA